MAFWLVQQKVGNTWMDAAGGRNKKHAEVVACSLPKGMGRIKRLPFYHRWYSEFIKMWGKPHH